MMKRLNMKVPGGKTFFQAIHYKNYLGQVIEVPGIKEIIEEVRKHKEQETTLKETFDNID
jgi:hypothetical protein